MVYNTYNGEIIQYASMRAAILLNDPSEMNYEDLLMITNAEYIAKKYSAFYSDARFLREAGDAIQDHLASVMVI